jgi:hypothetical protein
MLGRVSIEADENEPIALERQRNLPKPAPSSVPETGTKNAARCELTGFPPSGDHFRHGHAELDACQLALTKAQEWHVRRDYRSWIVCIYEIGVTNHPWRFIGECLGEKVVIAALGGGDAEHDKCNGG